jgi:hypothetical protein
LRLYFWIWVLRRIGHRWRYEGAKDGNEWLTRRRKLCVLMYCRKETVQVTCGVKRRAKSVARKRDERAATVSGDIRRMLPILVGRSHTHGPPQNVSLCIDVLFLAVGWI